MIRLADDEVFFELENLSLSIKKSSEDIGDDFRQNHYIEVTQGDIFYGTNNVIWAGFGPVGNTEKKMGGRL